MQNSKSLNLDQWLPHLKRKSLSEEKLTYILERLSYKFRQTAKSYSVPQPIEVTRYGSAPLLISAPHATPHLRQGKRKNIELMTGALAIALAQSLEASLILPAALQFDDPNFDNDETAPYKRALANELADYRLVVDIHGMRDSWGIDLCLGLGDLEPSPRLTRLINSLKAEALKRNFICSVNQPFDSTRLGTISNFVRQRGCEALQIELASSRRQVKSIARTFCLLREACRVWIMHDSGQNKIGN